MVNEDVTLPTLLLVSLVDVDADARAVVIYQTNSPRKKYLYTNTYGSSEMFPPMTL